MLSDVNLIESVLVHGDLSALSERDRVAYYLRVCESLGLNFYTQPFAYIRLQGKLTLYAKRDCCEQLRKLHGISIKVVRREMNVDLQTYSTEVEALDREGRTDCNIGVVGIAGLKGDQLGSAIMKSHTKAVRRVTLSLCGLGFLDETEVEDIPSRKTVELPQLPKPVEEIWRAWKTPEDAINWASTILPTFPLPVLELMFEELPAHNGKKAPTWAEKVLEMASF